MCTQIGHPSTLILSVLMLFTVPISTLPVVMTYSCSYSDDLNCTIEMECHDHEMSVFSTVVGVVAM